MYGNKIYPGVSIQNINFGGKTEKEVTDYFNKRNREIEGLTITITKDQDLATISAKDIHIGYDSRLLAHQAYSIGRSKYGFSNLILIIQSYLGTISLHPSYLYSSENFKEALTPLIQKYHREAQDALFTFDNGRVTTFRLSSDGQDVDIDSLDKQIQDKIPYILLTERKENFTIPLPLKTIRPRNTIADANDLGIKELIGSGTSLFQHSAESRIFNITHATSKINGLLVAPGEIFSFDKALGDISQETGFRQAYVIQNGKTVLGDGGGVCQVSTTFFRALLNAGVPIIERHAHAYRVGYYEEDSPPGLDATIFSPSVDLRFKNDTGHHILIQAIIDPIQMRLTFNLFGTKDNRIVELTKPVTSNESPAPPPLYQDDPTLPAGVIKQVDFAADGAVSVFSRKVSRDGKILYNDTFVSNYRPWQAIYLRGTKQ